MDNGNGTTSIKSHSKDEEKDKYEPSNVKDDAGDCACDKSNEEDVLGWGQG